MASKGKLGRKEIALLVALLGKRAKGASEEASRTFYGITSNINDLITHFKRLTAEAGVFDFVKQKLDEVRNKLDEMKRSGEMKKWAERLSNAMVKIGNAVWEAGKWLLTADLGGIGDTIRDAFKSLQEISADDLKRIFEDTRQSISGLARATFAPLLMPSRRWLTASLGPTTRSRTCGGSCPAMRVVMRFTAERRTCSSPIR